MINRDKTFTISTTEIRWFKNGEIPIDFLSWFHHLPGPITKQSPRVDYYYRNSKTNSSAIGIKIRDNKIEFKHSLGKLPEQEFSPGIHGIIEKFEKWSFPLGENFNDYISQNKDTKTWLPIRKDRQLKVISSENSCQSNIESINMYYLNIELTQLNIGNQYWWTLGFESSSEDKNISILMSSYLNKIFKDEEKIILTTDYSFGYSEWILDFLD